MWATNSLIALTKALCVGMSHNRFTPTLQFSLSPTPLCHNNCSNRNNIINVNHGNSRNTLNSCNIVRVYPRTYNKSVVEFITFVDGYNAK